MEPQPSPLERSEPESGFTLIELLVVLGIITLLAAAFSTDILGVFRQGDDAQTKARQTGVVSMIEGFHRVYGFYPPDDFTALDQQVKGMMLKRDPYNAGIETLVAYLSWEDQGGARLDEHEDWLGNTDSDKNSVMIPLLQRLHKMELIDAWGTPFAYFSARFGGYEGTQKIKTADLDGMQGTVLTAKPYKNPRSEGFLGPRTFQLISAGADLQFNTDDDIVYPELPIPQ